MLKGIVIFFAIVIGSFIGLHRALQNGSFLEYVDTHPHPDWTPRVLYTAGQGYYLFQDLSQAATYFWRIEDQFPKSKRAVDAAFLHVQVQDDQRLLTREELITAYELYLEKYPSSPHAEKAKSRISSYKTGAR